MRPLQFLARSNRHRPLVVVTLIGLVVLIVGWWYWLQSTSLADLYALRHGARLRVLTISRLDRQDSVIHGFRELEDRLFRGLADSLGTGVQTIVMSDRDRLLQRLVQGRAHLGAAVFTIGSLSGQQLQHSITLATSRLQAVYARGSKRPRSPSALVGRRIVVEAGSAASFYLQNLQQQFPALQWQETKSQDSIELLVDVAKGRLETTIVDRSLLMQARLVYSQLAVGYQAPQLIRLVWAIPASISSDLLQVINAYLRHVIASGVVSALRDRIFGVSDQLDFVDIRTFHRSLVSRLPQFKNDFILAGTKTGIDWRILAAQAYQESHWDADALSTTGAKGLMQLTGGVADEYSVADPFDPWQSCLGGARYLRQLIEQLPATMPYPAKRWAALAAYNYGLSNIRQARDRLIKKNRNPNLWYVLRQELLQPDMEVPEPAGQQVMARALQAVRYVDRIRGYYRILASTGQTRLPRDKKPGISVSR